MSYTAYKKKQEDLTKYTPSNDVTKAKNARDAALANDPRNNAQYGALSKTYLDQYLNRKDFTYNANLDPLYKQYAEAYKRNGERAMKDTIGTASALTGGYANSYAATAGQQQYNQYMDALNDKIPELYSLAYDRYMNEGNDLLNKYNLLYSADRQALEDYYTDVDFRNSLYQQEFGNDYGMFGDNRNYINGLASQYRDDYWKERQLAEEQRQFDAKLLAEAVGGEYDDMTSSIKANLYAAYESGGSEALGMEAVKLEGMGYDPEEIVRIIETIESGDFRDSYDYLVSEKFEPTSQMIADYNKMSPREFIAKYNKELRVAVGNWVSENY